MLSGSAVLTVVQVPPRAGDSLCNNHLVLTYKHTELFYHIYDTQMACSLKQQGKTPIINYHAGIL